MFKFLLLLCIAIPRQNACSQVSGTRQCPSWGRLIWNPNTAGDLGDLWELPEILGIPEANSSSLV